MQVFRNWNEVRIKRNQGPGAAIYPVVALCRLQGL